MRLTDDQIHDLTRKVRPSAQARELTAMGIPYRRRRDGSIVVLLSDLEPDPAAPTLTPDELIAQAEIDREKFIRSPQWFEENWRSFYVQPSDLVERAIPYAGSRKVGTSESGVYFLVDGGLIVYVGKAESISARIWTHRIEHAKHFERVSWIECPSPWNEEVEGYYISLLNPILNAKPGYKGRRMAELIKSP